MGTSALYFSACGLQRLAQLQGIAAQHLGGGLLAACGGDFTPQAEDADAEYERLVALGVEFFSPPNEITAGVNVVWHGAATSLAVPMALVGMAAFFGATVRAPVTAMVLVTEMTATTEVIVPMMAATAAAVLAAHLVGSPPIYDSLRERMPDEEAIERRGDG